MIVKKCEIRKEVKSTHEEETTKRIIIILKLKKKVGKSDVECVKDVLRRWVQDRDVRIWWMWCDCDREKMVQT